ncbi:DUF4142 domain-containing protein [Devosia sp. 1566]|uniref:DUF4142 domain-containing protein n=1 Tax=Devosia sp. 1566 TaxID=2499144 RepID=UPI000FD6E13D|nr:DUF4142 domain-containing protein [Devosia sp. 1566]
MRILALAALVLMSGTAFAQDAAPAAGGAAPAANPSASTTARTPVETPQFIEQAGFSGTFEIESSKLALEKAERDDVKEFAQHMIDEHTANSEALTDAVAATGIEIAVPTVLDPVHQQMMDTLEASTDFDMDYLKMQYQAHQDAISLFSSYAEAGEAGPIKEYAAASLPALNMHLEMLPEDAKPE